MDHFKEKEQFLANVTVKNLKNELSNKIDSNNLQCSSDH